MADKPSRALILYGDGLARSIGGSHTHLHSFASRACCCFLALPDSPSSGTRTITEFAELLDANAAIDTVNSKVPSEDRDQDRGVLPTMAERFMGMKAAMVTDNWSLKNLGSELGLTMFNWNNLCEKGSSESEIPLVASELLKMLGFQEGKLLDANHFDIAFVHFEAKEKIDALKYVELLNKLTGELFHMAESDVDSRLHVSIIMSYGANQADDHLNYSYSGSELLNNSVFSSVIPRQSYTMKGGKPRENIRNQCPMLLAQYQNAVTRKDMVEAFSFQDFAVNSGNLVIPADRFIHEVAFKIWKSPKYGA